MYLIAEIADLNERQLSLRPCLGLLWTLIRKVFAITREDDLQEVAVHILQHQSVHLHQIGLLSQ